MAALPYMRFYVADYLADTMHLTTEEHGAYLLLIFNYWQTGKPLPKSRLARIARVTDDRWTLVERTLSEFFHDTGAEWRHDRIERGLESVRQSRDQKSAAGRASAAARNAKNSTSVERPFNTCSTSILKEETKTKTEKDNPPLTPPSGEGSARKRFVPPTLDDVRDYCRQRGNSVNPEQWYDHYVSNGWRVGRNQMKDWKAAVRTWERSQIGTALETKDPREELMRGAL